MPKGMKLPVPQINLKEELVSSSEEKIYSHWELGRNTYA